MTPTTHVRFEIGGLVLEGWVNDRGTAVLLTKGLPIEFSMSRWGDEYYGPIGLNAACEGPMTEVVEIGDLAYWPPGDALCIFFGPTPVSEEGEPRAASPVCVVGHIEADPEALKALPPTVTARLEVSPQASGGSW